MKNILLLLILLLVGCNTGNKIDLNSRSPGNMRISSVSIDSGRLILNGSSLDSITRISATSANLSGYTMNIESKSARTLTIRLTHSSNSSLALAIGAVLTFVVSNASAQTTVNLTIETAVPTGTVVAYDGTTCPTGWSDYTDANGRVIVGSGNGNLDKDGVALTARTLNNTGGREVASIALPASSLEATESVPGPGNVIAAPMYGRDSVLSFAPLANTDSWFGSGDNDNMPPYIVLKYCRKD